MISPVAKIAFADASRGVIADKATLFVAVVALPAWWIHVQTAGEVAASVLPIAALALIVLRAFMVLAHPGQQKGKRAERAEKTVGGIATALTAALKYGKTVGVWLVAALGVVAVIMFLWRSDARAAPASSAQTAVGRRKPIDDAGEDETDGASEATNPEWPPWYSKAHADLGTLEGVGKRNNPKVLAYYADAGHPEIKHDETPWCAAFVGACLERAGIPSTKSLTASSYDTWGKDVRDSPQIGDVVRIWRESPRSWKGHVGFYVGETRAHVKLLGGNQSDAVSIASFPKSRIKAIRRPRSKLELRTNRGGLIAAGGGAGAAGAGAAAVAIDAEKPVQAAPPVIDTAKDVLERVQEPVSMIPTPSAQKIALILAIVLALISVGGALYVIYRRSKDHSETGA